MLEKLNQKSALILVSVIWLLVTGYAILRAPELWVFGRQFKSAQVGLVLCFWCASFGAFWALEKSTLDVRVKNFIFALVSAGVGAVCFKPAFPMGDARIWQEVLPKGELWLSEVGANWIYSFVINTKAENIVSPIFGFFTLWAMLALVKPLAEVFGAAYEALRRDFVALYLLSPLPIYFGFAYIENTQQTIALLFASIVFFLRYLSDRSSIVKPSLLLGIAFFIHGIAIFYIPLILVAVILRHTAQGTLNRRVFFKESAKGLAWFAGFPLAAIAVLKLIGYQVLPGNVNGGGDAQMFAPNLFSLTHVGFYSNIILTSLPSFPILGALILLSLSSLRERYGKVLTLVLTAALGYWLYAFIWGFDFGFPADLDLTISTSVVAFPLVLLCLQHRPGLKPLFWILNGVYTWAVISQIL